MMEMLAILLVGLGLGEFVAWLGIMFRYAIPRAPRTFLVLLTLPMLCCSFSTFSLAIVVLRGEGTTVLGMEGFELLLLYFLAQCVTFWTLNAYAVYWQLRGRRCPK